MTKEKEGLCVHVWIEDEPCHDVTQCLVHLSDYLQARGALQNLQRHNYESQEGNMRAMSCYQKSQSNSSLVICCHKFPALYMNNIPFPSALPQHPFLSLQPLFSLQPAHLLPPGTPELMSKPGLYFCVSLYTTHTQKTAYWKMQLLYMDRPWMHFGDTLFMHKK